MYTGTAIGLSRAWVSASSSDNLGDRRAIVM